MNQTVTAILLGVLVVFAAFCGWRGAKPPNIGRGPRMVPWRGMMVTSAAIILVLLAHLARLRGMS